MSKITELQNDITDLTTELENCKSPKQRQILVDQLAAKRRDIELASRKEQMVVPIVNAPTVGERKTTRESIFNGEGRIRF